MCFLAIVHNLVQYRVIDFKSNAHCGIPIVSWLNVFVLATVLKSLGGLGKIWVLWTSPQALQMFEFFKIFYIDGLMFGWIIYGNILFYSKKNNCDRVESTQGLHKLMFLFIIVGYMIVISYVVILIMNKCLCEMFPPPQYPEF
jgi:hypothetical protein